jgi:stage II sporulation protein D
VGIRRLKSVLVAVALAVGLATVATPEASASWVIRGHGFGHGVGMSQYGSYGYAQHGWSYKRILHHYYRHTTIGKAKEKRIRVLLTSGLNSVSFSGGKRACGHQLSQGRSYAFGVSGSKVVLESGSGKRLAGCGGAGTTRGGRSVDISGIGSYRGSLIAKLVGGSLYVINRVGLENYVEGVVPNEMPASWAQQALRVQAVAARSYALSTSSGSSIFDVYDDTRSQVYGGLATEQHASNVAVSKTAGQVVKYHGDVIVAYFSSTSGGHTENIENSFVGASPVRYLQGVPDRYDGISPVHSWKVGPLSRATVASRLSGLFSGKLKQIHVIRRGVSPRIVYARVVGSSGSSKVTGTTLRDRLNLMDSWLSFGKNETGVPAHRDHHHGGGGGGNGGGNHHGGGHHGGGGGGVSPGKAAVDPRSLVATGPAVQPRPGDLP